MAMAHKPFVTADVAAQFFEIRKQFLLSLARRGIGGSYTIGLVDQRKRWSFRLSELNDATTARYTR